MLKLDSYSRSFYANLGRIYLALASGAGRIWIPETTPMAMNMVKIEEPP